MNECKTERGRDEEERREEMKGREGKNKEKEDKQRWKGSRNIWTVSQGPHVIYQMTQKKREGSRE